MKKINKSALKKIEEVKELMSKKTKKEEIISLKFNRSIKNYNEYLKKFKDYFSEFPEYLSLSESESEEKSEEVELLKPETTDLTKYDVMEMEQVELEKLSARELSSLLVLHAPKILSMLKEVKNISLVKNFVEEKGNLAKLDDVLIVPDEVLKLNDKVNKTLRISKKVDKKFDEFSLQYPNYTKTTLLNMAIIEFMEKYGKKQ